MKHLGNYSSAALTRRGKNGFVNFMMCYLCVVLLLVFIFIFCILSFTCVAVLQSLRFDSLTRSSRLLVRARFGRSVGRATRRCDYSGFRVVVVVVVAVVVVVGVVVVGVVVFVYNCRQAVFGGNCR